MIAFKLGISGLLGRQFCATARSEKHNSNIIKFNELLYAAADEWAPVYVSAEWICSGCWLVMSLSFSVLWGSLPFLFSWLWHALLLLFICHGSLFKELALNCCIKLPPPPLPPFRTRFYSAWLLFVDAVDIHLTCKSLLFANISAVFSHLLNWMFYFLYIVKPSFNLPPLK